MSDHMSIQCPSVKCPLEPETIISLSDQTTCYGLTNCQIKEYGGNLKDIYLVAMDCESDHERQINFVYGLT